MDAELDFERRGKPPDAEVAIGAGVREVQLARNEIEQVSREAKGYWEKPSTTVASNAASQTADYRFNHATRVTLCLGSFISSFCTARTSLLSHK